MVNFESNLDRVKRGREQCLLFEENYLMLNRDIYIILVGMHLHFIVRPFDLKIRRKVKRAWFLWTVEFYGEGDERNGQISVKSRNLENLRGNINADTFISDHVVFFLEFFHRRKRERERREEVDETCRRVLKKNLSNAKKERSKRKETEVIVGWN